jgi:SET domain-containing protein
MKDELKIATKVAVRPSELHRYGLFAKEDIKKDEVIEETMFARTTHRSQNENRDPALYHYSYGINCSCETCQKEGINFAVPFGYCQYTNHSLEENAVLVHDYTESLTSLTALRDIEADEEITMNYGEGFQKWLDELNEIQEQMKLANSEQTEEFDKGPINFEQEKFPNKNQFKRGIKEMIDQANELNDEE